MRPPLRYPPSLLNDSPQARARFRRDYRVFLREAVQYLGAAAVAQDLHDIIKGQQGRAPDEKLNALLLAQYAAATAKGPVDIPDFSKGFYETQHVGQSAKAVEKRLRRLLQAQERKDERGRRLKAALQRPSLIGTE
jgi:hypothetical protein